MTDCLIRIKNFISELSKQKSKETERTFHFKGRSQGDNLNRIIFILYFFCDGEWYVILLLLQGMWATGGRGGGEGRDGSQRTEEAGQSAPYFCSVTTSSTMRLAKGGGRGRRGLHGLEFSHSATSASRHFNKVPLFLDCQHNFWLMWHPTKIF